MALRCPALLSDCNRLVPGLLLLLSACASTPEYQPVRIDPRTVPPQVEGKMATEYAMLESSSPKRPDWTLNEPDDKDGLHFMVAISEQHASEQAAREDAMKNARKAYAQYTGVEVSEVDELIRAMYGQSSEVLDPTVSGRSKSSQTTDAQVSRIKAKQWYWERYRASRAGLSLGNTYKYWVLVSVPTDEYDRVQQWKADKIAQKKQQEQQLDQRAEWELQELLKNHDARYKYLQEELDEGEPLEALTLIMPEWTRLDDGIQRFKEKGAAYQLRIPRLEAAQRDTIGWIETVRNSFMFDTGRAATYCALTSTRGFSLPVWVVSKTAQKKPIANLPLVLSEPNGKVVSRAFSDHYGRAEFQLSSLTPGRYRVGIDSKAGILATLDQNLVASFARAESFISVKSPLNELEGAIHNVVLRLFAGPNNKPLVANRVTLGRVTYGDSRQGSELSVTVQRQLRQELVRIPGLSVIDPRPRDAQLIEQAVTRGISMALSEAPSGTDPSRLPDLGSPAMQAVIDGADAALETSFTIAGSDVLLDLSLREAGTDKILAVATINVPRNNFPVELQIVPAAAPPVSAPQLAEPTADPIHLQVASHLGDGQTYQEGESVTWFVSADRDAYLLLLYEDVSHNLIQIYPNRYSDKTPIKAGSFVQIPGKKDRFEFTITAPFGLERVRAFASSSPFNPLPATELDNGLSLLQISLDQAINSLRRQNLYGRSPAYGEAETVITTVAKH